jgi:hypothetical protein
MNLRRNSGSVSLPPTHFKLPIKILVFLFLSTLSTVGLMFGCDDDPFGVEENISAPQRPTGPDTVSSYIQSEYTTGGAVSSKGHELEYRFDFDAAGSHIYSDWRSEPSASHDWKSLGDYVIKAQARCRIHPKNMSPWSEGKTVTVISGFETISIPYISSGPDTTDLNTLVTYCGDGAVSSKGHTIEYQFFFDSDGAHIFSDWVFLSFENDYCVNFKWFSWDDGLLTTNTYEPGIYTVKVRARCIDHPGAMSDWSAVKEVLVCPGPDTRITQVLNTYWRGQEMFTEWINIDDAVPDTVPFKSWITVFYEGWDDYYDSSLCDDQVSRCMTYEGALYWKSVRFPLFKSHTYFPGGTGLNDSTSMNIGSVEYEVAIRSINQFDVPDWTVPSVEIIGNFDPVLDSYSLINHDGLSTDDSDTLIWDWWAPADSQVLAGEQIRKKTFYFIISATGHDHPKDPPDSGVKSWYYSFYNLSGEFQRFARAASWIEGLSTNVLSDTLKFVFTYPIGDINGDDIFNNLPSWINQTYDFVIKGRDISLGELFQQYIYYSDEKHMVDAYPTSTLGRWTAEGGKRFYFAIKR